jgi:anti-sigma regulatory factor (Ser/Thr protein kinase)
MFRMAKVDEPSDADRIRLDLRLPRTVQAPAMARQALRGVSPRFDRDSFEDLRLLVSELVSNSVVHGDAGASSWVRLHVDLHDQTAEVEVSNPGRGFTPGPGRPGPDQESGRGLDMLRALADRWGVSSNNVTRVWFQLRAEPEAGHEAPPTEGRSP